MAETVSFFAIQTPQACRSQGATPNVQLLNAVGKWKPGWMKSKLTCSNDARRWRHRAPGNALESWSYQSRVERLWGQHFKDPNQWWDNRNNQHPKSSDFKHKSTKEALWIDNWNTPEWVTHIIEANKAGGRLEPGKTCGKWGFENGVGRLPQRNQFSWTQLISRHTKSGQFRQALRNYEKMRESGVQPSSYTFVAVLKACCGLQDLERAKNIHVQVVESGLQSDIFVGNVLIDVYAKSGSLVDARLVFEKMHHRNVVSWTAMMLGYVGIKKGEVALELYAQMQLEGVTPNDRTFVAALKACSSLAAVDGNNSGDGMLEKTRCLDHVKAIHLEIVRSGFKFDPILGTTLVDLYAKCGGLMDARCVFEDMPHRDVVSWNAMILGYAQTGAGEQALDLYTRMQQEGVEPNNRTFVAALKACSSMAVAQQRKKGGAKYVYKQCLEQVRAIHSQIVKSGSESDTFVGNILVDVYSKYGSLEDARYVFEKMPNRNVVSWNSIILGYAQMEQGEEALHLYKRMQQEGVIPNDRTYVGALKATGSLAALEAWTEGDGTRVKALCLEQVRAIHSDAVKSGSESGVFVGNALVDVYTKCGSLVDARFTFEKMPQQNVGSWNAMISGYAQMDQGEMAMELYTQMQQKGVVPDQITFLCALKACSSLACLEVVNKDDRKRVQSRHLEQVKAIHSDIVKSGSESDPIVGNMLLDVYAKCGSMVDARNVFEKMPCRNVVSWTCIILGYAQMEMGDMALCLYALMQQEGVVPDHRTFVGALKACGSLAQLEKGKEIHCQISKTGLQNADSFVATSLIDMYSKCGSMVDAQRLFEELPKRDIVIWNALLAGYARQGQSEIVFDLFETMKQGGIQPEAITFVILLTVCSHLGLVEEGKKFFEVMRKDFGIIPTMEHYSCMVDLLGRAGQLDKAIEVVQSLPFQPDGALWRSVLGACQKWGRVEIGIKAFESAVSLDKDDTAHIY